MKSQTDASCGCSLGQPTYRLWFRNPVQLFGSTTQREISIMQPAVLTEENTGDQMSHTYLSQPGGAHILPVTGMPRKVPEKWSPLRASHRPATTEHNDSDEQIINSQLAISGTITSTKYEKKVCVFWGWCPTKIFLLGICRCFPELLNQDPLETR